MPSDHEPCCEHGHSCRHEGGKSKAKAPSPKTPGSSTKKKGRGKKKDEFSSDALLAKIAELEASQAESSVPMPPPVILPPELTANIGRHIPADLRDKYLTQVAHTEWERQQIQGYQNKIAAIQKEREDILAEIAKVDDSRQKLDSLCKQLQARNKEVLEGVRERGEEEQQKRKALSEQFSTTIADITARMEVQQKERLRMAAENDGLRQQIEGMKDTILAREAVFKGQAERKDVELQALQKRLEDGEVHALADAQKFEDWRLSTEEQGTVIDDLRAQLQLYNLKFERFQTTLTKSNPVFVDYKVEMEKVSKRIRQLDTDNQQLRLTVARADLQIVDFAEQRAKAMNKATKLELENEDLQALAKRLTAERARLKTLKAARDKPPQPSDSPATAPSVAAH